jgi:hypothetical protein
MITDVSDIILVLANHHIRPLQMHMHVHSHGIFGLHSSLPRHEHYQCLDMRLAKASSAAPTQAAKMLASLLCNSMHWHD